MGIVSAEVVQLPEPRQSDTLTIDFSNRSITGVLNSYRFEDNGFIVTYIPSLGLSAYGQTVEEANEMMIHDVINDFFKTIIGMPPVAVFEELNNLGWISTKITEFKNQAFIDEEGILRNFDLPQDTPIERQLVTI
ncbi:hypothetical protein [Fibrella arboris]|uniref:hypothetical protein n=1 Tax=Fibrella arboris TaxID=3242486 RepID=UPI0035221E50